MIINTFRTIAAALVATIVVSGLCLSCRGRRASDMVPTGDTVEVAVCRADTTLAPCSGHDSIK